MGDFTVFYSWQNDLPRKVARDFIHGAAESAIRRLTLDTKVIDSPRLEHDTTGVAGVPPIGETILRRIESCGVFLADVSLVGNTLPSCKTSKKMPNSNVMLELGYAAGRVGWNRLIFVMNTENGGAQELPFDLRFRRFPFEYRVSDDRSDFASTQEKLSNYIELAIRTIQQDEHQAVTDILKKLDGGCRHFLKLQSGNLHFWEVDIGRKRLPGQTDFSIRRLLELGLLECVDHVHGEAGYAHTWTYLGILCIRRLLLPEPLTPSAEIQEVPQPPSVLLDMSWYERVDQSQQRKSDN